MGHTDTHKHLHQLFNDRAFERMEEHFALGFSYEDVAQGVTTKTPEEFLGYLRGWTAAFSDARVDSPTYLGGEDFSVCLFHARGKNDGPYGTVSATGRMIDQPFVEIMHFTSDDRILSGHLLYDQLGMLRQLGQLPDMAARPSGGEDDLEAVVRGLYDAFDRLDVERALALVSEDSQGVDELSARWLRGRADIEPYFRELAPQLSDVRTEISDVSQRRWGDVGLVTMWVDQDYAIEGEMMRISAPTSVVLHREGGGWKVALLHSVPLPEQV